METVLILDANEKELFLNEGRCILALNEYEQVVSVIYPYTHIQSYHGTMQEFCKKFQNRYWAVVQDNIATIERKH
jgi:hypothetical protein